jgi:multiple sugar transport system substrate-binding protein
MLYSSRRLLLVPVVITLLQALACGSDEEKILRVWQTETDKGAVEELEKTAKAFESDHPGVRVELESVAWSSLSDKLSVAIQAKNEPDVAHLEPFMVSSLVGQNLLIPLDDVIATIESANGRIYAGVRDLQLFEGKRYGIAYAIGTTGWAYRKDLADTLGLAVPANWNEYVDFASRMKSGGGGQSGLPVLLPGGDPFFVDQLFGELVANNGGKLFDPETNRPLLTTQPVLETFAFFERLRPTFDGGWQTQPYLDQFNRLGRGEAGNVPVTYARAARAIDAVLLESGGGSPEQLQPSAFAMMAQPVGPSSAGPSIATIDCEPFVIFRSSEDKGNADLAKDFLRLFYSHNRYLAFVKRVPIQLTPIFLRMANSPAYLEDPFIKRWSHWAENSASFLKDPRRVRPILMPDVSEKGRQLRFLLEFQASKILTQSVSSVIRGDRKVEEAAAWAQERAEALIESLGFRRW